MDMKKLIEQLQRTNTVMIDASVTRSKKNLDRAFKEYGDLRRMIDGFISFVSHRWHVKLFTFDSSVEIPIRAEHLEEAREIAVTLCDSFPKIVRFELYCDGVLIPEYS